MHLILLDRYNDRISDVCSSCTHISASSCADPRDADGNSARGGEPPLLVLKSTRCSPKFRRPSFVPPTTQASPHLSALPGSI